MLRISKFKLINHGSGGILIEGTEVSAIDNNYAVIDKIKRERSLMLSSDLILRIQQLKYYFLNLTGHWVAPYTNYYDMAGHKPKPIVPDEEGKIKPAQEMLRHLWNNTQITGLSYKNNGFVITGQIEVVDGKSITINTPFITEDDDIGFFNDAIDKMHEVVVGIIDYMNSRSLNAYEKKGILSESEIKDLDINDISKKVVDKLIDKGMIILVNDGEQGSLQETTSSMTVNTNTNNIDGANLPEAEEAHGEEEDDPRDKAVKQNLGAVKKDVFGPPSSAKEFPLADPNEDAIGKDLEVFEHSSNTGTDTQSGEDNWND